MVGVEPLTLTSHPDLVLLPRRSPHWPAVRAAWLRDHPACAACGGTGDVEVHHKIPYHVDRSKELDRDNFITLCMAAVWEDHFVVGHHRDWRNFNRHVVADAARLLAERTGNARGTT